jgi:hypothetical protein
MKKILGKVDSSANKILAMLLFLVLGIQNVFAQTSSLAIPASAETTLTGLINDNFGIIIGVVIVVVGAGLLIKFIKKVG